ncbi:MAG: molybdopterin converting factor subunit 1 [Hyphomicrobiaceae bacterium]
MKILYFAWVREKVGKSGEEIAVPESVVTISDLVQYLRALGPEYAEAFARPDVVRAAIDRTHVKPSREIAGAREIAFFPPVTGG